MANIINKTLNFPEEIHTDKQGLSFHIIEKGTKIYRGDSNFNTNYYKNEDGEINYDEMNMEMLGDKKFVFFGFSLDDILNFNYGRPFEFEVIKEGGLRLLRVDNIETLRKIHDSSNREEIKKIIKDHYILNDKEERDSKKEKDYAFIEYLCETYPNYDGYISDKVKQDLTLLNAEMAICNPFEKVKLIKKLKGNKSDEQYTLDLKEIKNKLEIKEKRQQAKTSKRNFLNDERESLFTSPKKQKQPGSEASGNVNDSLEMQTTPNTSPQKGNLFGNYFTPGGKKKSKKSKKMKKAKKQTRKKKGKKN